MIRRIFATLALAASAFASAEQPSSQYGIVSSTGSYSLTWANTGSSTTVEACGKAAAVVNGVYAGGAGNYNGVYQVVGNYCELYIGEGSAPPNGSKHDLLIQSRQWCSDGSAPDTSKPLSEQCTAPVTCPPAGTMLSNYSYPIGYVGADTRPIGPQYIPRADPSNGLVISIAGCGVRLTEQVTCAAPIATLEPVLAYCIYLTASTGEPLDLPPVETPPQPDWFPDPNGKCPYGTTPGGVDSEGMTICMGGAPTPADGAGTTTTTQGPEVTNPDGSKSQTTTTDTKNADGSTTTRNDTTTTNPDGSKSTSSTTTTGKTATGQQGQSDENADFCKKNPQLTICKNSEISGECEQTVCRGDVVQCAIAQAARQDLCRQKKAEEVMGASAQYLLGQQMLAGNDPMKDQFPTKDNGHVVDMPTTLDQSGFLGGGACFPDFQFSVAGRSFSIPFSSLCDYLIALRGLIMLLAALASWRLVSKSILG